MDPRFEELLSEAEAGSDNSAHLRASKRRKSAESVRGEHAMQL